MIAVPSIQFPLHPFWGRGQGQAGTRVILRYLSVHTLFRYWMGPFWFLVVIGDFIASLVLLVPATDTEIIDYNQRLATPFFHT